MEASLEMSKQGFVTTGWQGEEILEGQAVSLIQFKKYTQIPFLLYTLEKLFTS
jgi:hypothetical protein